MKSVFTVKDGEGKPCNVSVETNGPGKVYSRELDKDFNSVGYKIEVPHLEITDEKAHHRHIRRVNQELGNEFHYKLSTVIV